MALATKVPEEGNRGAWLKLGLVGEQIRSEGIT